MNNQAIGILDSGVGGLSIWNEIVRELPGESTIYIGDSAFAPYGRLSAKKIYTRAKKLINFLVKKDVKLIVIACNTITVYWIDKLREGFPAVPIIGTVPVVRTAAISTKNKKIGILSTSRTALSKYQNELINKYAGNCTVVIQGTDELVPLIERGLLKGKRLEMILQDVLRVFKDENVDVVALGCTHFPFLREPIQRILGRDVLLLDSGAAIARQVRRILDNNNTLNRSLFFDTASGFAKASSFAKASADKQGEIVLYEFYSTSNVSIAKKILVSTIGKGKNTRFEPVKL